MKYLGLNLDSRWDFRIHFQKVTPRALRAVNALGRLMPNLGGPSNGVCRFYGGVVRSTLMYEAPI